MDYDELDSRIRTLSASRDQIQTEIKQLSAERNRLEAQQNAETIVNNMTDSERAALAQVIGLSGVNSSMVVGSN